ncbi:TPA: hypothetical protein I8Y95_000970 [Legionella pneumophila]|nr:hypothetical protein [Legionella pneumophila]HAT1762005.1 hypothetical protein [Legionella pneumophila]HAT1811480.1 hypothetical protein [Legionella pneumophila]HAT1815606.1 hypothetical protein [Legionella pneumophila]HAT8718158.1 hypothetical protein [Legionella pneumophila]
MKQLSDGFALINRENCLLYKNATGFITLSALDAIQIFENPTVENFKNKMSLIIAHTGVLLILKSILLATIKQEQKDFELFALNDPELIIQEGKISIRPKKNTIGHQDLINRIKDCGYDIAPIKDDFHYINEVRNQIVHHFNESPIEELKTNMISVFSMVNAICGQYSETFWGESLWGNLKKLSGQSLHLLQKCKESYQKISFKPIEYYFRCLKCSSHLLLIIQKNKEFQFQCQFCKANITKESLISSLESSKSFYNTHQIIQYLSVYGKNFSKGDKEKILAARENNSQIYGIQTDDDISLFYDKLENII